MNYANADLIMPFPTSLRQDAIRIVSALPEPPRTSRTFSVRVGEETLSIPDRIYHDPGLVNSVPFTPMQVELFDCLLTRHHNGFVREKHLAKILGSSHVWIPAFVVRLVGEYVIEILLRIRDGIQGVDPQVYQGFLKDNPDFYLITKQRVVSYWHCYYKSQRREDYPGFQIVEYFERLITASNGAPGSR
jgi:hypothetical protein